MSHDSETMLWWLERLEKSGEIHKEVDGFFVYQPKSGGWLLSAHVLRAIADYLDAKNAEWKKQIETVLKQPATQLEEP